MVIFTYKSGGLFLLKEPEHPAARTRCFTGINSLAMSEYFPLVFVVLFISAAEHFFSFNLQCAQSLPAKQH